MPLVTAGLSTNYICNLILEVTPLSMMHVSKQECTARIVQHSNLEAFSHVNYDFQNFNERDSSEKFHKKNPETQFCNFLFKMY